MYESEPEWPCSKYPEKTGIKNCRWGKKKKNRANKLEDGAKVADIMAG
jgi:hypothetical protein